LSFFVVFAVSLEDVVIIPHRFWFVNTFLKVFSILLNFFYSTVFQAKTRRMSAALTIEKRGRRSEPKRAESDKPAAAG
jgi:hypothetical protein